MKKSWLLPLLLAVLLVLSACTGTSTNPSGTEADYDVTMTAASVGDVSITVPIYNYFYNQTVSNYGQFLMSFYGLKANVPLAEQTYGDATFEELLIEQTDSMLQQCLNVYAAAKEAGYKLTEEDQAAIEKSMNGLKETAAQEGYESPDAYLAVTFGPGCTEANYREYMEIYQTAYSYSKYLLANEFAPTDEAIAAEYAANPDRYDVVNFSYVATTSESDAKAAEASFPEDNVSSSSGNKDTLEGNLGEEIAAWLLDGSRKAGDVKRFADISGEGYVAVRFDSRDNNDYHRMKAYIVLIDMSNVDDVEEGAIPPQQAADNILSQTTEDMDDAAFEQLVRDNGYAANLRIVAKDDYADDITDFLYNENPAVGDYASFYIGKILYIVRFVGVDEETYQHALVREALTSDTEDMWYAAQAQAYPLQINDEARKHAMTNLTLEG